MFSEKTLKNEEKFKVFHFQNVRFEKCKRLLYTLDGKK